MTTHTRVSTLFVWLLASFVLAPPISATTPGRDTGALPPAFRQKAQSLPLGSAPFRVKRGLLKLAQRTQFARFSAAHTLQAQSFLSDPQITALQQQFSAAAIQQMPQKIQGQRRIPVVTANFHEYANPPYPVADLQRELFDGPWPTGTMSQYYSEISSGSLSLSGLVSPWAQLAHDSSYYEGADYFSTETQRMEPCFGVCSNSKVHELISEALSTSANSGLDWGRFDNDGPDNVPNSGDDDGFVDFVAFVHSEPGSECQNGSRNIWSYSSSLSDSPAGVYETASPKHGGGFIKIDDYTIQPALDCTGNQMIQIGVFSHEFGHAFGLPDLYDTDRSNGTSSGVGNWCLMSGGSWGGDGHSPERPSHMSPWAKAYLGWIDETPVTQDESNATLIDVLTSHSARRMRISANMYYLIANVAKTGFNDRLPAGGIQIWKINETVIRSSLSSNRVNADSHNRGVELIEADNNHGLDDVNNRGEAGDVFPGSGNKRKFDVGTSPASVGQVALCSIPDAAQQMRVRMLVSRNRCGLAAATPAAPAPAPSEANSPPPTAPPPAPPSAVTVDSIQQMPSGAHVVTQGVLRNLGKSVFTARDRRIALVAPDGTFVDVAVAGAKEVSPGRTGVEPGALPALLDKVVVVEGVVERVSTESGEQTRIRVESVKPVAAAPPQ
jgi:M6 family metalloprotease-like protein